jgi:hypothetical protein
VGFAVAADNIKVFRATMLSGRGETGGSAYGELSILPRLPTTADAVVTIIMTRSKERYTSQ